METNGMEDEAITAWTVADIEDLTMQGEQRGEALVAKASGRAHGGNAREFQDALETLLDEKVTALALDLEHLSYISSAGLRVILIIARQLQTRGAKFGVCSLSDSISEVFQVSGFDQIIRIHATQADAVTAFNE